MVRTPIYLTQEERSALQTMAKQTGQSQSDLIRQAIDFMIESKKDANKNAALQAAKGM